MLVRELSNSNNNHKNRSP